MTTANAKRTVLVIEDEPDIRKLACRLLELEGFAVLEADSGERGLDLARQNNCTVVLLDLRLPGRDG